MDTNPWRRGALAIVIGTLGWARVALGAPPRVLDVVMTIDGDRTVATILPPPPDPARPFDLVIPVPSATLSGTARVVGSDPVEHLDAYTAPRLAAYTDANPCAPPVDFELRVAPPPALRNGAAVASAHVDRGALPSPETGGAPQEPPHEPPRILPGPASDPTRSWIRVGASPAPIVISYGGTQLELPFVLGRDGAARGAPADQLVLHVLTRTGKAELAGRTTVSVPSGSELPPLVKDEFGRFYAALFGVTAAKSPPGAAFLEYAGDLGFCDPCISDPLPIPELQALGASWAAEPAPKTGAALTAEAPGSHRGGARNVFVTRLRLALGGEHRPDALTVRETTDRRDVQVRFVIRRPYQGPIACAQADAYRERLARREEDGYRAISALTGWPRAEIEKRAPR